MAKRKRNKKTKMCQWTLEDISKDDAILVENIKKTSVSHRIVVHKDFKNNLPEGFIFIEDL
jgi:hypothetical protein